jgi:hypothetical protein
MRETASPLRAGAPGEATFGKLFAVAGLDKQDVSTRLGAVTGMARLGFPSDRLMTRIETSGIDLADGARNTAIATLKSDKMLAEALVKPALDEISLIRGKVETIEKAAVAAPSSKAFDAVSMKVDGLDQQFAKVREETEAIAAKTQEFERFGKRLDEVETLRKALDAQLAENRKLIARVEKIEVGLGPKPKTTTRKTTTRKGG